MQDIDLRNILNRLKQSDQHSTSFTEEWTQGRSAFGGLAASMASCAMIKLLPTPQPMRSLMVSFIAPLPPAEVSVVPQIMRQGKNVTQTSASLISGGNVCLQAMGVFGNPRDTLKVQPDPQFNPEPRHPKAAIDNARRGIPPFLRFFDGYWTGGGIPFSGSQDERLGMWVRHRSDLAEFPTEKIISICDIPPPVILSHYTQPPVHAASLTWSLEFVIPPESVNTDWFYLDFKVDHAADGYTQQSGRIFTEEGRLCALSRQCMVYFG
ncbi:MAG: thioesterase family protein [Pseudohongiellaceae bacterium]